jgi:hypothetical protein
MCVVPVPKKFSEEINETRGRHLIFPMGIEICAFAYANDL